MKLIDPCKDTKVIGYQYGHQPQLLGFSAATIWKYVKVQSDDRMFCFAFYLDAAVVRIEFHALYEKKQTISQLI